MPVIATLEDARRFGGRRAQDAELARLRDAHHAAQVKERAALHCLIESGEVQDDDPFTEAGPFLLAHQAAKDELEAARRARMAYLTTGGYLPQADAEPCDFEDDFRQDLVWSGEAA